MNSAGTDSYIWWKHGVIYHIYPRSFQDSDNDGIGDLRGIIRRLGYLADLGIDAIWLSPVYKSPMVDFGYDVSCFHDIDPSFGTLDEFRELLGKAHASGIRVIMDMVLNHTSNQHPWFLESSSSLTNPKRNWYIWREGTGGQPPNNWKSAVGGSAWKYDPRTGHHYLHSFFEEQPDLNWRDPDLPEVFFEELKFWLDMGVDGFRFDVINMVAKDKRFRNNPAVFGIPALQKHVYTRNRKRSVKIVTKVRQLLDSYKDKVSIGEIYVPPPGNSKVAARYLAGGDNGIHLAFDFSLVFSRWNAKNYFRCIKAWYENIPADGWPCNVLSNHDLLRSINRVPWRMNRDEKAKVAATLLLTIKGTPFIYYGEEIGMHNGSIPRRRLRDPLGKRFWPLFSGRDQARTPMQWNQERYGGFTDGVPWLPSNKDYTYRNVRLQEGDPGSLLNHYRDLIRLHRRSEALQKGAWIPEIEGKNGVLAYFRMAETEIVLVVLNFSGKDKTISINTFSYGIVLHSTHRVPDENNYYQQLRLSSYEASVWQVIE